VNHLGLNFLSHIFRKSPQLDAKLLELVKIRKEWIILVLIFQHWDSASQEIPRRTSSLLIYVKYY
jgi:hypothetical protein